MLHKYQVTPLDHIVEISQRQAQEITYYVQIEGKVSMACEALKLNSDGWRMTPIS